MKKTASFCTIAVLKEGAKGGGNRLVDRLASDRKALKEKVAERLEHLGGW